MIKHGYMKATLDNTVWRLQDYNYNEDMADPISGTNQQSPLKENGTINSIDGSNGALDSTIFSHMPFRKKKSPLRMGKKVYEFYNAPITKFWAHAVSIVFIFYSYSSVITKICSLFKVHLFMWSGIQNVQVV